MRRIAPTVVVTAGLLFLVAPTMVVLALSLNGGDYLRFPPRELSLRWYGVFLGDQHWTGALWRSTILASVAASLATAIGTGAAWHFVHAPGIVARFVRVIAISPILLPPIVLGVGSFVAYSNLGLYGNPIALVLTHTVLGVPYALTLGGIAISRLDKRLEMAARGLGASPFRTAIVITLPRLAPTLATSWGLAFLTSFDEVVITSFILPRGLGSTLPIQLMSQLQSALTPLIAAVSGVLVLAAVGAAIIGGWRLVPGRRSRPTLAPQKQP